MINFSGTPKIKTDRLILRRFQLHDAQSAFDHWLSDERISNNPISEIISILQNKFMERGLSNRPFIVAIDGLSGSGKTTLANIVAQELNSQNRTARIIHIDDHIVERSKRYNTGYDEWYEYYYLQWEIEWLKKQMFEKLHNNMTQLTLPFYDKSTDSVSNKHITVDTAILIVEGVFLQRKEWKSYFDFTIFIDSPRELRFKRVLTRDGYTGDEQKRLNKYQTRYWPAEEYYLEVEDPIKQADMIYKTTD